MYAAIVDAEFLLLTQPSTDDGDPMYTKRHTIHNFSASCQVDYLRDLALVWHQIQCFLSLLMRFEGKARHLGQAPTHWPVLYEHDQLITVNLMCDCAATLDDCKF